MTPPTIGQIDHLSRDELIALVNRVEQAHQAPAGAHCELGSRTQLDFTRKRRIDMEIKPQAVVIPKETDHLEKGKYGPIFPRTPACYGFTSSFHEDRHQHGFR